MRSKKSVAIFAGIMLAAGGVMAQVETTTTTTTTTTYTMHAWNDPNSWWHEHFVYTTADLYRANEMSFDMFGSYLHTERRVESLFHTDIRNNGFWGGGVGLNYFGTRYMGVGGDINIPNNGGNFVDSMAGSLIARLPLDPTGLAPYVFGGGGRQTDPAWEWEGHLGVGLELRFNPVTGLFTDARYNWVRNTPDTLLLRAGLRFSF